MVLKKEKPEKLKPIEKPEQDSTYYELKSLIEKSGIIKPLIVTEDGLIIDGCRRHLVAIELKSTYVDVFEVEVQDENEARWLRAAMHAGRRSGTLSDITPLLSSDNPPIQVVSQQPFRESYQLANDMLCARGFGPRVLAAIIRKQPIIFLDNDEEDDSQSLQENTREILETLMEEMEEFND